MPLPEPGQAAPPDFSNHPDYQPLFDTLVAGGQSREHAFLLLTDLWQKRADNNAQQQHAGPQPPEPQQLPGDQGQQQAQADQDVPDQPGQAQLPHEPRRPPQPPIPNHENIPDHQQRDRHQGQDPQPLALGVPLAPQEADKRGPHLPAIDLDAESRTASLQRPTAYAIDKFRKFEYVPLWYFTEQGCQAADKDKASNDDLWDVTKTSDNRLSLRAAASNRPSPNALSDEQLTWEQFMDANHLLCRWLIPAGWPEDYAKILSSFFWQLKNHEDKAIVDGKETLLLYQARTRKAWHDELKAGHFFNLAKLNEKTMNTYRKEVESKHNAALRKAVSLPKPIPI
jgi:hypothetical protein